jgi:hypothetical protein
VAAAKSTFQSFSWDRLMRLVWRVIRQASIVRIASVNGPGLIVAYGANLDATGGGAAEVRRVVAACLLLGYGLTNRRSAWLGGRDPYLP